MFSEKTDFELDENNRWVISAKIIPWKEFEGEYASLMDLIDRFAEIFPHAEIDYLCGDRELMGKEWLRYLIPNPI